MKWEYLEVKLCSVEQMNFWGQQGWELIAVCKSEPRKVEGVYISDEFFYFKRPIKEEESVDDFPWEDYS